MRMAAIERLGNTRNVSVWIGPERRAWKTCCAVNSGLVATGSEWRRKADVEAICLHWNGYARIGRAGKEWERMKNETPGPKRGPKAETLEKLRQVKALIEQGKPLSVACEELDTYASIWHNYKDLLYDDEGYEELFV